MFTVQFCTDWSGEVEAVGLVVKFILTWPDL